MTFPTSIVWATLRSNWSRPWSMVSTPSGRRILNCKRSTECKFLENFETFFLPLFPNFHKIPLLDQIPPNRYSFSILNIPSNCSPNIEDLFWWVHLAAAVRFFGKIKAPTTGFEPSNLGKHLVWTHLAKSAALRAGEEDFIKERGRLLLRQSCKK